MRRTTLLLSVMVATLLVASGVAWAATIVGTNGNDTRNGTANRDYMYGLNGNDQLSGRAGDDQIEGGGANDTLNGDGGNDVVDGGGGNDTLNPGGAEAFGIQQAYGGTGQDTITINVGEFSEAYGSYGNDTINSRDGVFDRVDCGSFQSASNTAPDFDTLTADAFDSRVNCENIVP
jgi:Ca2+-binding RTX toxin-like protein